MGTGAIDTLSLPSIQAADEAFLVRVRRGDPAAIAEAYDAHHLALCSFARRLLADDHAAEDLVQDVFLVLPSIVHRLKEHVPLRAFLLGIAANRARHHFRALARRRRFSERFGREPKKAVEDPERLNERRSLAARLELALARLSLEHRVTFVLKEIEGYETRDAALILGVPEATVRTRLFHARQRLRVLLEAEEAP